MKTFKVIKKSKRTQARIGRLQTEHGLVETPFFMSPATKGYLKSLDSLDMKTIGTKVALVNTYHLFLNPGDKFIKKFGGIHKFMNWSGPILSDSGGFQVWSLNERQGQLTKIKNDGVEFKSPYDGSKCFIDAKKSIEIQHNLGVDIVMAFDECSKDNGEKMDIIKSMDLTHKWLVKSLEYHKKLNKGKKLFFGIVQGGSFIDLRQESLKFVIDQNPDGIAFGGETIGYNMKESNRLLDKLIPNCPENKPRYTMGLGAKSQDIVEAMIHGVDMFDCVSPARVARHGELFVGNLNFTNFKIKSNEKNNIIRIANSKYKNDKKPIDKNCQCPVCQQYSRAYLRYLFLQKEPLFMRLASLHNIYFMNDIINQMKKYIKYE